MALCACLLVLGLDRWIAGGEGASSPSQKNRAYIMFATRPYTAHSIREAGMLGYALGDLRIQHVMIKGNSMVLVLSVKMFMPSGIVNLYNLPSPIHSFDRNKPTPDSGKRFS